MFHLLTLLSTANQIIFETNLQNRVKKDILWKPQYNCFFFQFFLAQLPFFCTNSIQMPMLSLAVKNEIEYFHILRFLSIHDLSGSATCEASDIFSLWC